RRYKANNPVPLAARQIYLCSFVQIPDDCLTNRIFGFDYDLWRYWIPLPFDGNPILTLPDVVASAGTISVTATQNPFGGPHMLKPLTYFRRNILELPSIHCSSSRANCTEHQRSDEWLSFAVSKHRTQLANRARALCDDGHRLLSTIYSQGSAYTKVSSAWLKGRVLTRIQAQSRLRNM